MDYEMMKALEEASREESSAQRKPQVKEFPKPDIGNTVQKERRAA